MCMYLATALELLVAALSDNFRAAESIRVDFVGGGEKELSRRLLLFLETELSSSESEISII